MGCSRAVLLPDQLGLDRSEFVSLSSQAAIERGNAVLDQIENILSELAEGRPGGCLRSVFRLPQMHPQPLVVQRAIWFLSILAFELV